MRSRRVGALRIAVGGGTLVLAVALSVPMASAATSARHGGHSKHGSAGCKSANGVRVSGGAASAICQGLKAYRGKTVTFVAPDKPGGGFDQYARIYAPYLAKYLGATVNVTNIPAGNTVAGQNYVASTNTSNPGFTTGWLNAGPDIEDTVLGLKGIQFNPTGEAFLGATAPDLVATAAFNSSACAAWDHSFASMLRTNSASNPVSEPMQTTGSTTFDMLMIDGSFGIHFKATLGYASSADLVAGWVRGDGCVITDPVSVIASYVKAGKATPLLTNIAVPRSNEYYAQFVGVPSWAQAEKTYSKYIKSHAQKLGAKVLLVAGQTSRILFVPPKTPKPLQAAMRAAYFWASHNKNLTSQLNSIGATSGYYTAAKAKSNYIAFLNGTKKVTQFLSTIAQH